MEDRTMTKRADDTPANEESTPLTQDAVPSVDLSKEENDPMSQPKIHRHHTAEGGWGWVIVFVSFMSNFLIDGTVSSFGLLYPKLLLKLQSSPAVVSFAGSLIAGCYLSMGAVTSNLIQRVGCRPVAMIGGCIAGLGFLLSMTTANTTIFLLTYGVLSGIGFGMVYIPAMVLVNSYFTKKRGIVQGIVTSGSGVGILVLAPVTEVLLETFDLSGTLLLTSGFVLHICVFAALMRNPPITVGNTERLSITISEVESSNIEDNSNSSPVSEQNKFVKEVTCFMPNNNVAKSTPNLLISSPKNCFYSEESLRTAKNNFENTISGEAFNPLKRKDLFFSASLNHLKEFRSTLSIEEYLANIMSDADKETTISGSNVDLPCYRKTIGRCKDILCGSYFCNFPFILLTTGAVLIQLANYIPTFFLGEYALSIGLSLKDTSLLLAIYGIMNTLGRFSAGILANCSYIGALATCNFGVLCCALDCFLFRFCMTFQTLCAFSAALGYFLGFFPPTQPLILVEYLGLEKLTQSFGIITMVKGPATVLGPPLAGVIFQWTNRFDLSNAFAGILLTMAFLVQLLIPMSNRWTKKNQQ
ncbi:hypothetical protein ScPMuIL_014305 [Solemya velum]